VEFAGKHHSTHDSISRAKIAVVDVITTKASWVWPAEIQSTVRLERCDLMREGCSEKDWETLRCYDVCSILPHAKDYFSESVRSSAKLMLIIAPGGATANGIIAFCRLSYSGRLAKPLPIQVGPHYSCTKSAVLFQNRSFSGWQGCIPENEARFHPP
jgi:hypothetical protein